MIGKDSAINTAVRRRLERYALLVPLSLLLAGVIGGCGSRASAPKPVYLIAVIDETASFVGSGYWDNATNRIATMVGRLNPGDQVCVIGIDHHGFDSGDVRIPVTALPKGALKSIQLKRELCRMIRELKPRSSSSGSSGPDGKPKGLPKGTDMLGAIGHAAHFASRASGVDVALVVCSDFRNEPTDSPTGMADRPIAFPSNSRFAALFVEERGGSEWYGRVSRWVDVMKQMGVTCKENEFYTGSEVTDGTVDSITRRHAH